MAIFESIDQISQHLENTIVPYDNKPVQIKYVSDNNLDAEEDTDDFNEEYLQEVSLHYKDTDGQTRDAKVLDPSWDGFILPEIGWLNYLNTLPTGNNVDFVPRFRGEDDIVNRNEGEEVGNPSPVLLKRVPARRTVRGWSNTNTIFSQLKNGNIESCMSTRNTFETVLFSDGFQEFLKGIYPSLKEVLECSPTGTGFALSPVYMVHTDPDELHWLYRRDARVGLIINNRLSLFRSFSFYLEEIQQEEALTFDNIEVI